MRHLVNEIMDLISTKYSPLIILHDNPDPDAIASGFGLTMLIDRVLGKSCTITYSGVIGRAENQALVRLLDIPLKHSALISYKDYDCFILIDCQPKRGNVLLPENLGVDIVIDHHPIIQSMEGISIQDIREDIEATALIVMEYFRMLEVPISRRLATAIFYAVKSDIRQFDQIDAAELAFRDLAKQVDWRTLFEIENPPIPLGYYRFLDMALDSGLKAGSLLALHLPEVSSPDVVPQVADFFYPMSDISIILSTGYYQGTMYFSLRTKSRQYNAGELAASLAENMGRGGGHDIMAAGKITDLPGNSNELKDIEKYLREKLRAIAQVEEEFDLLFPSQPANS